MTDTTAPEPIRIPFAHSVHYAVRGLPEVPNQYGIGVLAPSEITLTYRAAPDSQLGRVHAYVAGRIWVDGKELPLLSGGLYGQHYDDGLDGWPEWLAEEARLHDPAASAAVVPAADRAAPCRTTQHCAHHGWCHRCDPEFAAVMSRLNVAIQRTDSDESHWGPLYEAVGAELRKVLPAPADRAAVPSAAGSADTGSETQGPWLVRKICCGHDDGEAEFATWKEADRFREIYVDSSRIAGHERSAIVRAATAPAAAVPVAGVAADTTGSCAHCGEPVRQVTGTLNVWWVHTPGGNTVCHSEHAATSTRAEPGPVVPAQPGGEA